MGEQSPRVDILLATFFLDNYERGEEYLRLQLDSLVAQDYPNFRILIRDDASPNPLARKIIEEYQARYPELIKVVPTDTDNLGYAGNFEKLMEASDAEYVCFADQDDIWYPHKVSHSIATMQAQEAEKGKDTPLLVHHDARIMNSDGEPVHGSMANNFDDDYADSHLERITYRTATYGFTITANRALVDKALPFPTPSDKVGHDGHLGVVARVFGDIFYDKTKLVDYRIHDNNTSGPRIKGEEPARVGFLPRIKRVFNTLAKVRKTFKSRFDYAGAFVEQHRADPNFKPEDRRILSDYAKLGQGWNPVERLQIMMKHNFYAKFKKAVLVTAFMPW